MCEGRKLAVDKFKKASFCWAGSEKGPGTCHTLYSSKIMPPQPCVWDAERFLCDSDDTLVCLKCQKCGTITAGTIEDDVNLIGMRSCCAVDGAWHGKCGNDDESEFTWTHGLKACQCKERIPCV